MPNIYDKIGVNWSDCQSLNVNLNMNCLRDLKVARVSARASLS